MTAKADICNKRTALGIEFGSTRIKAVLVNLSGEVLAVGIHDWENSFENGIWTFHLQDIYAGLRSCYQSLKQEVRRQYGITLTGFGAMGVSAMMHGYMAFDAAGELLAPFQTWRNTNTQEAANRLTELFQFNIPLRWTVAHLYQRILDQEKHVQELDYVSTLAGFIHWQLTGERVIGIGDASGMFPVDPVKNDYVDAMVQQFDELLQPYGYSWQLRHVLPRVLVAGEDAGRLTQHGVGLLDADGDLQAGIPFCPPEGDAGTGMTATNAVAPRTGNVSAGTSTFAMIVLERPLANLHREIDMVATPTGAPCAMSHANNGTTDLNAWVNIFGEFAQLMGYEVSKGDLFTQLYTNSLNGDADCGGLLPYGYYSGENITMINEGRPIFLRTVDSRFNLANFMKANLYTSLGAVKMGLDILKEEGVEVDRIMGHGGFFKTKGVGQRYLSAACEAPVIVMNTASEGGAWGIALLAAYRLDRQPGESLGDYLNHRIFAELDGDSVEASQDEINGFNKFMQHYRAGLCVEKAAIAALDW
ncbi:Sugar (pentulose or hexulose) kinase [Selenomonas ruminantium]|uniref:Sugar (Pentulose or hexulose) kinase n=1 Tax=Selenomonas ruminantium TaxID=971 RepID=A0A1M6UDW4_SELRU|nr:FGGY-family carbohydrate kinase [Selenomonas ruminantium]SHK67404.1 Sugar (pentulose or hexulose) kinase [Selenomonas ruminantium]